MYLVDKTYISDFLINTIKENHFKIVATKEAKELVKDTTLNWISEKKSDSNSKKQPFS
jgi:hypothetical protein